MSTFAVSLVIIGFLACLLAQVLVAIGAFRDSPVIGLLCFIVPGYLLFYAIREKERKPGPLACWTFGFALVIIGVMLGA